MRGGWLCQGSDWESDGGGLGVAEEPKVYAAGLVWVLSLLAKEEAKGSPKGSVAEDKGEVKLLPKGGGAVPVGVAV